MNQITARTPEASADEWIGYIEARDFKAADALLESFPDEEEFCTKFDAAVQTKRPEWHPNGEYDIEIATGGVVKSAEKRAAETYVELAKADDPKSLHGFLLMNCLLGGLSFDKLMRAVSDLQPEWLFVIPSDGSNRGTCIPAEIARREVARMNAEGDALITKTRAERFPELAQPN